ncbi:DUF2784 domain-containing protein [Cupriavidus sp. AU9028]|uniref:DUF2784 domain-containing protein n=1 Tax=Cupriavidus sp. AU9028 TaxID=2871157 RepID=UPI001C981C13|nr:DUF2784 domain-containing protein [Cupriavidus sp. AU9028]MBY4899036.1 DUF2784 domain-containing protein [Cupriavidus sp. AU9028]
MAALFADAVVVLHLAFVAFVVAGGMLVWRWPAMAWLHLPAALWGATVEWTGWICPLTPLENRLRAAAGEAGYESGFVEHYLLPLLYPAALARETQLVLGALVVLVNVAVYALWWRTRRRAQFRDPR